MPSAARLSPLVWMLVIVTVSFLIYTIYDIYRIQQIFSDGRIEKPEALLRGYIATVILLAISTASIFIVIRNSADSRMRLQKALDKRNQADRRFMDIFDATSGELMIVDKDGRIKHANRKSAQLLGYSVDELSGMPVENLLPDELREKHVRLREGFVRAPDIRTMNQGNNLGAKRKDGKIITMAIDIRPIQIEDDTSVLVTMHDRTAELERDKRNKEHARALKQSNEELDNFAYVASHDLKAPLRGISQLAAIIEEDTRELLPEDSLSDLAMLRNRVTRMEHLLDSLLQYCRVGRNEDRMHQIEMDSFVRRIAELFVPEERFQLVIKGKLPCLTVPETALEIVLRNLLMNAVKHHDKAQGIIEIELLCSESQACLTVTDDGPGIPQKHAEKVFLMFQTLKRRDEVEGSGMGLALVRKIMESFGGTIELKTEYKDGARFQLCWPIFERPDISSGADLAFTQTGSS